MAEVRPYDIASLCFDVRGQKFVVIVGSQISKLATGRKAASFFELLQLGVKRAVDLKFQANANPEDKREYKDGLFALIPTNPLHVADEIHSQLHGICFYQWLRQEFRQFKIRNSQPTSILKCLQKVGGRLLTTNYDLILEKSRLPPNCKFGGEIPESDRPLNILTEGDYEDIEEVIAGPKQAILHLFGTYETQFVFTTSDHKRYTSNDDAMAHLQSVFYHSHVLFVGFEKDDPFLNTLYKVMMNELRMEKRLGSTRNRHYILVPNSDMRTFSDHFKGVLPVPYGSSPDELVNFLRKILEAIDSHQRGQKRRKDDDEDNGDLPAGIKRAHLISEDYRAIRQTEEVVPEYFNVPKDKVQFGADTGPFASIHFSIDVPEEYIPRIWEEALRTNNVFVKCGCMAIQIGTGPMLWMREHHGPEQPLPGQQPDGVANQGDGQGAWTKIKPRRRAWHSLPDRKPFEIQQQVKVSARDHGDQAKAWFTNLKRTLKERFGCSSVYRWSRNFVTFVCQGREDNVKPAVKYLQQQSQEHISKQYSKKDKSDRQFACEDCDVVWWAYVPKDNPVTLCPKCNTCYKALKYWDQYGYAYFECKNYTCGLKFEGSDRFSKRSSIECPRCSETVQPYRIRRPYQKPLAVKRPSELTLSPFTTKGAVQKNVQPRISDKRSRNEQVGSTVKPQEQKQTPKSLTKDAQQILTIWPKSSKPANVEDTAKIDDASEASLVHPKPLRHPFTSKRELKPNASPFQDQVSDFQPEMLRSQEEKSKPTQRYHVPQISRSKYQIKKEREQQRKSVSRRRKFRMNSTSSFTRKDSSIPPVVSRVGEQDGRYVPEITKGELLSEPSNGQLPVEQSGQFSATQAGELPEVVQKLFQYLGELPASTSLVGHSDTATTSISNGEFPRERSHIAHSASGFSPNILRKLLIEPPETGKLVPDAALDDRKGSMEASLTSHPLLRAVISSSSMFSETTDTNHSTADIGFIPTALSETQNFLTSETATKLTAAIRATVSKSTSQNSFQEMVLEADTQGGSSSTATDVHAHTAQHPMESNLEGDWPDLESLPSESCVEAKPSDVELLTSSETQTAHSDFSSNSRILHSRVEVTHRVEANRIVQTAISNALERVGDKQTHLLRTQDFKSEESILCPEVLPVDGMRAAAHITHRSTCTHGGSNLDVTNSGISPESDLEILLPSSERQDRKESCLILPLQLPGGETENPVVFCSPVQADINHQQTHLDQKRPGEETAKTDFMYNKLQSTVQNLSSEQVKDRIDSSTETSQEVGSDATSDRSLDINTRTALNRILVSRTKGKVMPATVDGSLGNEKSCSLDTVVAVETTVKEQEFPTVQLVPEVKHISEYKAAEECKLLVHQITAITSARVVDTTSVYSEELEVKVEELQKGEGSLRSGAHDTFLLRLSEEEDSSSPCNKSNKDSRIQVSASSEELLREEPLASPLVLEVIENSGPRTFPDASSFDAHVSPEKLEPEPKVVFGVSSDLLGRKHDINVERDAEECKVQIPETTVACNNPSEDADHCLGVGCAEEHQALNNTHTTATSTSATTSFEIGIPSDDGACPVSITLEQQSKLHASAQPDSTNNADADPHSFDPGSSNTHTGKVAQPEKAEVVIIRREGASTSVERTTDSLMAQLPYCNADIVSPEMRPKTSEPDAEDASDSKESHIQTSKEQLDPLKVCLVAKETSTVNQTIVKPKPEGITLNGELNPQEEGMPCIDNGLEPHSTLGSDQGKSQVTECDVCRTEPVLDILDDILEAAVQEGDHTRAPCSICNPKEQEQLPEFGSLSPMYQQEEIRASLKEEAKTNPSSSSHTDNIAHTKQTKMVMDRLQDSADTSELLHGTLDCSMAQLHRSADIASPEMRPETSEPSGEDVSVSEESNLQINQEQLHPLEVCLMAKESSTVKQSLMVPRTSKPEGITLNGEVNAQVEGMLCMDNGLEPHSTLRSDQGRSQVSECEVCGTELVDILNDIFEAAVQEGDHTSSPCSICNQRAQQLPEFGSSSPMSQQDEISASLEEAKTSPSTASSPHTGKVAHAKPAAMVIDDSADTSERVQETPDSSMVQPHRSADIANPEMMDETSEPGREDVCVSEQSHCQSNKDIISVKEIPEEPTISKHEEIPLNVEANFQEEGVHCIDDRLDSSTLSSDQGKLQVTECKVSKTEHVLNDLVEAAVQEGDHACVPSDICNLREQEQLPEVSSSSPVSRRDEQDARINPSSSTHEGNVASVELTEVVVGRPEDSTHTSPVRRPSDSSIAQPPTGSTVTATPEMKSKPATESDREDIGEESYFQSSKEGDPSVVFVVAGGTVKETLEEPKPEGIQPKVDKIPQGNDISETCSENGLGVLKGVVHEDDESVVQPRNCAFTSLDTCYSTEQEQLPETGSYSSVTQQDEFRAGLERERKINPSRNPHTGEVAQAEKTKMVVLTDTLKLVQKVPDSPIAEPLRSNTERPQMFPSESSVEDIKDPEELHLHTDSKEQIDPIEVCCVAKETLSTTSEEPNRPKSEDIPLSESMDSPKNLSVNNGSECQSAQTIDIDQSAVGTTECGTVHVIALDILNDIIYAVIQKCHACIPDSPLTPKSGADFRHNESFSFVIEEDKGRVERKGIEFAVGDGDESSTVSAKEIKYSGMSPPYSETDNESKLSGSDGYEQDASETEGEEIVAPSNSVSQSPQDAATTEMEYTLEPQEETAVDQWLSEPDVPKQDTSVPFQRHHSTVPSVFKKLEPHHPSPPETRTRTKKRPRYLSKFKDKDQKIRRNVYIPSERHNCTGDTDDETRSAGLQAKPVVFEFKQEIF